MAPATSTTVASALSHDTQTALRNAAKLTASLVATWSVGLVVRFWLPRYLGPERFGLMSFADGLAATVLLCAGLGIDTYVQKEIPIRPHTASDFFAGTVILRVALSAALITGLLVVPLRAGLPEIRELLLVFGFGYLLLALNNSFAALLQANATIDELARTNVTTKIVWGAGMGFGILLRLPLAGFAFVFAASEALKLFLLQGVTRRRLALRWRLNREATKVVVVASLGFYASSVVQGLGWRLDVTMLGFLAHASDVGWYGASQTLAGITLLLTPILAAVLMPLFSRAHARSSDEMIAVLRRALEGIVSITLPVALFLALGAEIWIRVAFGAAFAPAAGSLRALAPLFVLIYVSILLGTALVVEGRGWRLTAIAVGGIAVSATTALVLVPFCSTWLGPGGAGTGMALAAVTKELVVASCLLSAIGTGVIDRQRRSMLARSVLIVLCTTGAHVALGRLGHWRLLVDLVLYPVLAIGWGVLRPQAMFAIARELAAERRQTPPADASQPG
jgi:O-antigen/teichoic acid export membrane protein